MISTALDIAQDEEKEICWVDMKVTDINSREVLREIRLEEGTKVKVDPLNPVKMKHRDREGEVVGFNRDEKGFIDRVKVKFDDTKRVGLVDFGDIIEDKQL